MRRASWEAIIRRPTGGPLTAVFGGAVVLSLLACFVFTERPVAADIPKKKFFEDYIAEKARTYSLYLKQGIEPYLAMTLENNTAFRCITARGEEVDFEGYVQIYKYTFDHFVYKKIEPAAVEIERIDDDQILVTYTMSMAGSTRAGSPWQVERRNKYTFQRIGPDEVQKVKELNPQNLEKYFGKDEDKWIVTRIEYE